MQLSGSIKNLGQKSSKNQELINISKNT